MSGIDSLIESLCPQGAPFFKLFEVSNYVRGITYSKDDEDEQGQFSVLRANNINMHSNSFDLSGLRRVKSSVRVRADQKIVSGDILMCAASGSKAHVGKVAYFKEAPGKNILFGGFMAVIRANGIINPRFLFHLLIGKNFSDYLERSLNTTTINNISASLLESFKVPVPPLKVQLEIVRILDTFTELESELEKELETRKRQYEHYRNRLMNFPKQGVRWVPMAEFCQRNKGTTITADKMRSLHKHAGEVRIFAAGSTQALVDRSDIPQKDIVEKPGIVIKSRGYIGFEFCETPFSHKAELWSYCVDETQALPRFVMHYLETQTAKLQALARSKSVKLPQLAVADTDKLEVPLPSLKQQKVICELLDSFEILTRDLVSGLPAEIQARRRQYEHYRDKLLTFKELAA